MRVIESILASERAERERERERECAAHARARESERKNNEVEHCMQVADLQNLIAYIVAY